VRHQEQEEGIRQYLAPHLLLPLLLLVGEGVKTEMVEALRLGMEGAEAVVGMVILLEGLEIHPQQVLSRATMAEAQ
jgi:hypothetical protein